MDNNKFLGLILMGSGLFIFVYYTTWIYILPFISPEHWIHTLFLSKEYAILMPSTLLYVAVALGSLLVSIILLKDSNDKKNQ